ncbi:ATP-binding protein [Brevibacillus fluminis]|uniref:ATP-binding protein n=1 Tax=Brevibacillus fluminis TaxID=511487 RepID=UPI003F8A992B
MMKELEFTFTTLDVFQKIRPHVIQYVRENLKGNSALMEVALMEAINNAWEHGGKKDANRGVRVRLRVQNGKRLIIRVKDDGPGFHANEKLKQINVEEGNLFERCLYEESGRGLLLMNQAADKITYNRQGNEVLMVKALPVKRGKPFFPPH